MNEAEMSPLEQVLRMCAAAAPEPWYPREFVRQTRTSKDNLSLIIENLLLDGLVERTTGTEATGPGLVLSPVGAKLLRDPEALQRLRQGLSINEGERGGIVREALRRRETPIVSRILLGLNLLVFVFSAYLASNKGILQIYLTSALGQDLNPADARQFNAVLLESGGINAECWLRGDWWRLLTAGFVHVGFLHLAMNMYFLYRAGGFLEQMWGRTRFLLIYLIADVVGNGIGLAHSARIGSLAGASGSLCGIIAAEAVWVWLNGQYLPRSVAARWRNNLMINFVLIVFISLVPGVSAWDHFGGAVGGALTALVLHYQRFGPSPWRWAVLVVLLPIWLVGYREIQRMRCSRQTVRLPVLGFRLSDDSWKDVEELDYEKRFHSAIQTTMPKDERQQFRTLVESQLDKNADRREEADITKALTFLAEERQKWSGYLPLINRAGPYCQPPAIMLLNGDISAVDDHVKLFELAENCLKAGKLWKPEEEAALQKQRELVRDLDLATKSAKPDPTPPPPDDTELKEFNKNVVPKISKMQKELPDIWDTANALRLTEARDRKPVVVEKTLLRIKAERQKLTELADELHGAGPSRDKSVEKGRVTARDFLREWARFLEMTERSLQKPDQWTDDDTKKLDTQLERAKQAEKDWEALLE